MFGFSRQRRARPPAYRRQPRTGAMPLSPVVLGSDAVAMPFCTIRSWNTARLPVVVLFRPLVSTP